MKQHTKNFEAGQSSARKLFEENSVTDPPIIAELMARSALLHTFPDGLEFRQIDDTLAGLLLDGKPAESVFLAVLREDDRIVGVFLGAANGAGCPCPVVIEGAFR